MDTIIEWLNPPVVWFIVGFILIILEFGIPGLITLFFGIGAWIVAILTLFIDMSINVQLLIFISISIISLIFLRKHFKKLFQDKLGKDKFGLSELDEFIGHKAVVTIDISPESNGKVEFRGTQWKAESDENLHAGTNVEIVQKDNITLFVKSPKKEV